MPELTQPHLVLWGEKDGWIPPADLKAMAVEQAAPTPGALDSPHGVHEGEGSDGQPSLPGGEGARTA